MDIAIDHEKKKRIDAAAIMDKVPLAQLDKLIKDRNVCALNQYLEMVELYNATIRRLLAV